METFDNIGQTLSDIRNEQKMSLQDLALSTGLSKSYLSDIENGKRNPSLKIVNEIAKALGTDGNTIIIKAEVEANFPKAKRKLLRDFAPLLEEMAKTLKEFYGDDDGDGGNDNGNNKLEKVDDKVVRSEGKVLESV